MAARLGADDNLHHELGELAEKHRLTRERSARAADELEEGNRTLRELLDAYKQADDALERSRKP